MERNDLTSYHALLLEEGRLKLQQWAFGRCLFRAWQKNKSTEYDYSNDPAAVSQAARTLLAAATPQQREDAIALFKMAWWNFHLYLVPREIGKVKETFCTLMGNVRKAMRDGNSIPLLVLDINRVSKEAGKKLAKVILFPAKNEKKAD